MCLFPSFIQPESFRPFLQDFLASAMWPVFLRRRVSAVQVSGSLVWDLKPITREAFDRAEAWVSGVPVHRPPPVIGGDRGDSNFGIALHRELFRQGFGRSPEYDAELFAQPQVWIGEGFELQRGESSSLDSHRGADGKGDAAAAEMKGKNHEEMKEENRRGMLKEKKKSKRSRKKGKID